MTATATWKIDGDHVVVYAESPAGAREVRVPLHILTDWMAKHRPKMLAEARIATMDPPPGFTLQPCTACSGSGGDL